jgi:hypothetical protein
LEIDTDDMAIRIPQEKLESLKADLMFYSKQKRIHCPEKYAPQPIAADPALSVKSSKTSLSVQLDSGK